MNGHLVIVSPLPPTRSGIADYTVGLIEHLRSSWHVTVVVEDGSVAVPPFDDVDVIHASSWGWYSVSAQIDRILWCVGNSMFHTHVEPGIKAHGGVVLAHDVRLNSLCAYRAINRRDPSTLVDAIRDRYGDAATEIFVRNLPITTMSPAAACLELRRRLDASGANLLRGVVQYAQSVLVHSASAQALVDGELGEHGPLVAQVPFGHPPLSASDARDSTLISTFGLVAPEKGDDVLLEAFAIARRSIDGLRLAYVGPVDPQRQADLSRLAEERRVGGSVTFTGWLAHEHFDDWLSRSGAAIQLRVTDNGESSAAVAACLSAGVPTVVSETGALAEIDDAAVMKVKACARAAELAEVIVSLVSDSQQRAAKSHSGQQYATLRSFAVAAEGISRALCEIPRPRSV